MLHAGRHQPSNGAWKFALANHHQWRVGRCDLRPTDYIRSWYTESGTDGQCHRHLQSNAQCRWEHRHCHDHDISYAPRANEPGGPGVAYVEVQFQLSTTIRAPPNDTRKQHWQLGSDEEIARSSLRRPPTAKFAPQLCLRLSFLRAGLPGLCGTRFLLQEGRQTSRSHRGALKKPSHEPNHKKE